MTRTLISSLILLSACSTQKPVLVNASQLFLQDRRLTVTGTPFKVVAVNDVGWCRDVLNYITGLETEIKLCRESKQ